MGTWINMMFYSPLNLGFPMFRTNPGSTTLSSHHWSDLKATPVKCALNREHDVLKTTGLRGTLFSDKPTWSIDGLILWLYIYFQVAAKLLTQVHPNMTSPVYPFTLLELNMASWKLAHLQMIVTSRPPFIGHFPLPRLFTKGHRIFEDIGLEWFLLLVNS